MIQSQKYTLTIKVAKHRSHTCSNTLLYPVTNPGSINSATVGGGVAAGVVVALLVIVTLLVIVFALVYMKTRKIKTYSQ